LDWEATSFAFTHLEASLGLKPSENMDRRRGCFRFPLLLLLFIQSLNIV